IEFVNSHDSILHKVFSFNDSKIHYELIISADSLKQNNLFQRAKIWQVKMLNSPKYSQQFEDKEGGFIALQAAFSEPYSDPLTKGSIIDLSFFFSLKIYVKDYKAKIVIDDIKMVGVDSEQEPIETHFLTQTKKADYMISQLPKKMQKRFNNYDERENELKAIAKTYEFANLEFISLMNDFKNAIISKSEADF
ncbi:MAG: DUF4468 domain-containing protein, partial [Ginsengibacter sp.]